METEPDGDGWLAVSSDGMPLCQVKYNGNCIVNDNPYLSEEYLGKIAEVQNELLTVKEYVGLYEHSPQMKAADVSEYRQLDSFGNTVFGEDYSPNYEYAKGSFAVRSGLIPESRLFSEQEQQLGKLEEKFLYGYPSLEAEPPTFEHSAEPQQNM